jgi:NAD(P)-dependent dehydrogenase (short-subunit alcohol dehydrogenase family)
VTLNRNFRVSFPATNAEVCPVNIKTIMERLKNKTALITGGTSGIGLATAKDFINEGAKVIITGRNRKTLWQTVEMLGNNAHGIVCDNASMADIANLKEHIEAITPSIDIVFANAGYGKFAPVEAVTEELFDELYNVLVKGTYFTIKEVLHLVNKGGSVIVNTSIVSEYGSPNSSIYSSAKAAVSSLVRNLASELTDKNIRINAVSPGYTKTDIFNKTGMAAEQIAGVKEYVNSILPYKRFAEADEIAKAVSFLASDDASYIHGAEIKIDGGYTAIR